MSSMSLSTKASDTATSFFSPTIKRGANPHIVEPGPRDPLPAMLRPRPIGAQVLADSFQNSRFWFDSACVKLFKDFSAVVVTLQTFCDGSGCF